MTVPRTPIIQRIIVAEDNPEAAQPMQRIIQVKLEDQLDGIEIQVQIVDTLAELLRLSPAANASIIDLNLKDAGPEEVIAAMPLIRRPFFVLTGVEDKDIHARCKIAGASDVFEKGIAREGEWCCALLHCLRVGVLIQLEESCKNDAGRK